jgi:hypothetical protein
MTTVLYSSKVVIDVCVFFFGSVSRSFVQLKNL